MKTLLLAPFFALATLTAAIGTEPQQQSKIELEGLIQTMPKEGHVGEWKVANKTVKVNAATVIDEEDGKAVVGKKVEVKGHVAADGTITATKIETEK